MTRQRNKRRLTALDALDRLYGDQVRRLTGDAYPEALSRLRKKEGQAVARRVDRVLQPTLQRVFPRRSISWSETSQGMHARLALMPENPYLEQDAAAIRSLLRIPPDQIRAVNGSPEWNALAPMVKPGAVRIVLEGNLAGWWLEAHAAAVAGRPILDLVELLPRPLLASAVMAADAKLDASEAPRWLRRRPQGPAPYDGLGTPLEWAVGRLVERHRVPWRWAVAMSFYVLTLNPDAFAELRWPEVEVAPQDVAALRGTFTVTVRGLDEFTPEEHWNTIWRDYVRPRQERLWYQRGRKPSGRRLTDTDRLKAAIPLFRAVVSGQIARRQLGGRPSKALTDALMDLLPERNLESIRRTIRDLDHLLEPRE